MNPPRLSTVKKFAQEQKILRLLPAVLLEWQSKFIGSDGFLSLAISEIPLDISLSH
jgi:hypothetical protein